MISVVTVSWNVREYLRDNLSRIFALLGPEREVWVVDNASKDGSAKMVAEEFPEAHLIENDWNAGYGAASNAAVKHAKGDVVLFLNPDMRLEGDALLRIAEVLKDRTVGAMTGKLVNEKGDVVFTVRRDPTFWSQLAIFFKLPHFFPRAASRYRFEDFNYGLGQNIPQARGAFLAVRRSVLDVVGAFDERFYVWFEDVDLCRRIREAGWHIRYVPDVRAVDFQGRSFAQVSVWKKQWLFFSSAAKYFWKWKRTPLPPV